MQWPLLGKVIGKVNFIGKFTAMGKFSSHIRNWNCLVVILAKAVKSLSSPVV